MVQRTTVKITELPVLDLANEPLDGTERLIILKDTDEDAKFESYRISLTDFIAYGGGGGGGPGLSAYQLAVQQGFQGTLTQWLASLVGPPGASGTDGDDGAPGQSAYQLALTAGFSGSLPQWLASLTGPEGPEGPQGPQGKSAYQVALDNGFVGSEAEWLASLVGPQGPPGEGGGTANPPVNTSLPYIGGILTDGEEGIANVGEWANMTGNNFSVQWRRNGVNTSVGLTRIFDSADAAAGPNVTIHVVGTEGSLAGSADSLPVDIAPPLTISGTPPDARIGETFLWEPVIEGGHAPYTVTFGPNFPPGMGQDTETGALSADIDDLTTPGLYEDLTLTVTDDDGLTNTLTVSINVQTMATPGPTWLVGMELLSDRLVASSQSIDGHIVAQSNGCHLRVHYDIGVIGTLLGWDPTAVRMPECGGPGFLPDGTESFNLRPLEVHGVGRPYRPYPEGDDAGEVRYLDYEAGAGYFDVVLSQRLYNDPTLDFTGRALRTSSGPIHFDEGFLVGSNGPSEAGVAPESMLVRSDSLTYAEIGPTTFKPLIDIYPNVPANANLFVEFEVGSWFPRDGQPVACLEAWTWNGTAAGPVVRVSEMTELSYTAGLSAPSGLTAATMAATLSFNGLPHGPVGFQAQAKPWEGPCVTSLQLGDDFAVAYTQNLFKTFPVYHNLNNDRYPIYGKVDPVGGRTTANKLGIFTTKAAALADVGFINADLVADSAVLYNLDSAIKGVGKTHDTTDGPLHIVHPASPGAIGSDAGSYCLDVQLNAKTGYFPIILESESGVASTDGIMRGRTRAGASILLTAKTIGPLAKKIKIKGMILDGMGTAGDDRTVIYGGPAALSHPLGADASYWSVEDCEIYGEVAGASRFPLDGTGVLYLRRNIIQNNRYRTGFDGFNGAIVSIGNKMTGDTNVDATCSIADWMTDGAVTGPNNDVGNQVLFCQVSSPAGRPNVLPTRQLFVHNSRYDTWNFGGLGACNIPPGRAKDLQLIYWAGLIQGGRYANLNNTNIDLSDDLIVHGIERFICLGMTSSAMPLRGDEGVGLMRINLMYNDHGWTGANKTGCFRFSYVTALPSKNSFFIQNPAVQHDGAGRALVWDSGRKYFPAEIVYDASGGLLPSTGAPTASARQFKPDGTKIEFIPAGTPMTNNDYWYMTGTNVTGPQANRNRSANYREGVDSYCLLHSSSRYPSGGLTIGPEHTLSDFEFPGSFNIPGGRSFGDVDPATLYVSDVADIGADPNDQDFHPAPNSPLIGRRPANCRWDTLDPHGAIRPTDQNGAACAFELIPDTVPEDFTFGSVSGADLGATYTSGNASPTGVNVLTPISVENGEYSFDGINFTSADGMYVPDSPLYARGVASAEYDTPIDVLVTLGGVVGTYTIHTVAEGSAPVNLTRPLLTGLTAEGKANINRPIGCDIGSWSGSPDTFTLQFTRNGADIAGASGPPGTTYTPTAADTLFDYVFDCRVRAENENGFDEETASNPANVFHPYSLAVAFWDLEDVAKVTVVGGKVTAWTSRGTAINPITASEYNGSGVTYNAAASNMNNRPAITGNLTSMYLEALLTGVSHPSGTGTGNQDLTSLPVGSTPCEVFALVSNADAAINTRGLFGWSNASTSGDRQKSLAKTNVGGIGGIQAAAGAGSGTVRTSDKAPLSGRQVVHAIYNADSVEVRLNNVAGSASTVGTLNGQSQRLRIMASPVNVSVNPANYGSASLNAVGIFPALTVAQRESIYLWANARLGL